MILNLVAAQRAAGLAGLASRRAIRAALILFGLERV